MIIWLVLLIFFAFTGFSWFRGSAWNNRENPLDILDRRFAEGEIDEREYVRKKDAITRQKR